MRKLMALFLGALLSATAVVAFAVSSTDTQANQGQVADVEGSNTSAKFPTNKQNEPTIAVNPLDPTKLIGGANDEQKQPPCGPGLVRGPDVPANDCSFFPNVGTSAFYRSVNGGTSWTNGGMLPGFTDSNPNNALVSDGDPVIVYGPKPDSTAPKGFSFTNGARAYYASLASFRTTARRDRQAPELLTVSASDNDGAAWSNPVIAAHGHGFIFNDKENIWADASASSPFFGRVYVSWTQFRDLPGFSEPIMVAFSADGGSTWSRPNQISIAQNIAFGGRQSSALRSGADGRVYLVWLDSDVHGVKQVVATSSNGGVTWSRARTIAYLTGVMKDPIPGANFRTGPYPSIATGGGATYVAWVDEISGVGRVVVSKSTNGGASWSAPTAVSPSADGYAFFQGLDVAPNGRIDIAYQAVHSVGDATTYGRDNAKVDSFYVSSSDGTWPSTPSTSTKISSVSSDPAASSQNNLRRQFWGDYNTLVSTNSTAWFIYTDSRDGVGCAAVDAFQHKVTAGTATPDDKPAPGNVCDPQFGNTNIFVSRITITP